MLVPGPVSNEPGARALVEAMGSLLPQFPSMRLVCAGTDSGGHDTLAAGDDFFSYRRNTLQGERDYGRGLSAIALRP